MGAPVLVVHEKDAAEEIREDVGAFCDHITMLGADVLIVMYERIKTAGGADRRSAGGIIIPDVKNGTAVEDKWQGKVGLVMKLGPIAFKDDATHDWGGVAPKVGDWVIINVSETFSYDIPVYAKGQSRQSSPIGERRARIVQDIYIKGIVSPDVFAAIW